jgi:hypothetical protein
MFATFSSEAIVARTMRELKITGPFLSVLSGVISAPVLSYWLQGIRQIDSAKAKVLEETCRDLQNIAELVKPWPLNYRDANLWRTLLEDFRRANAIAVESK